MTYVIGLAGPPGSGKNALADELATLFQRVHGVQPYVTAMAEPLRQIAGLLTGVDMTDDQLYAEAKITPFPHLAQDTARQVMIRMTEDYLKPRYGKNIWANALVQRVDKHRWGETPLNGRVVIITDVGFSYERDVIEEAFPKVAFVQLDRPGKSYAGDSRQSIDKGPFDKKCVRLVNPGTSAHQLTALAGRVHDFVLNRLLWDLPAEQISLLGIDDGD